MIKNIAKLGIAATLVAVAPLAFAQTTTTDSSSTMYTSTSASTTGTGTTGSTPGVPNTGFGGDAASNMLMLATSGVIALAGIGYLATRRGVRA